MNRKKSSVEIQYADRILSELNRVESLRYNACSGVDFSIQSEEAARLWHTAEAMEDVIIRENSLPDLDQILSKIMTWADTCTGMVGGDFPIHSYVASAKALWSIMMFVDMNVNRRMKKLLELIWIDGYTVTYDAWHYPSRKMFEWKLPGEKNPRDAEAAEVQAAMDRAVAEAESQPEFINSVRTRQDGGMDRAVAESQPEFINSVRTQQDGGEA